MLRNAQRLKERYKVAKSAKVGQEISCPCCDFKFKKSHYAQAFCRSKGKTRCKDHYYNNVDPKKRNNTTRISPANAAFLARREEEHYYDEHPFSSEALGQD